MNEEPICHLQLEKTDTKIRVPQYVPSVYKAKRNYGFDVIDGIWDDFPKEISLASMTLFIGKLMW